MKTMTASNQSAEQLRSVIERVEKLEEEKAALGADIRDVFAEAKGNGFDVKAIRQVIKLRRIDANERNQQEAVLDVYKRALGMEPSSDESVQIQAT